MAGGFAHVTLVDRAHLRLDEVADLSDADRLAIGTLPTACQLGAVGPDYPYLAVASLRFGQGPWADRMHYDRTAEPIRAGIRLLRTMPAAADRSRAMAWLFGYAAHVATDLTIHPVVMAKVGPYKGNEAAHRTCEMHQDVHIWASQDLGDISNSEYFDAIYEPNTVGGALHPAIKGLWEGMLKAAYEEAYGHSPPRIDAWHSGFHRAIDTAEDMPVLARHLLDTSGQGYPTLDKVKDEYIFRLDTPRGTMHYDDVCALAVDNILGVWGLMGRALSAPNDGAAQAALAALPDADLDTGLLLADGTTHALWSIA